MTDDLRIALSDLLHKAQIEEDADFLRGGMRVFAQAVMELAVTQHLGAERHARAAGRTGQRNGYRERRVPSGRVDTRVGTIELQVPRVRDGSYFPALLDPRRRAERALTAVCVGVAEGGNAHRLEEFVRIPTIPTGIQQLLLITLALASHEG